MSFKIDGWNTPVGGLGESFGLGGITGADPMAQAGEPANMGLDFFSFIDNTFKMVIDLFTPIQAASRIDVHHVQHEAQPNFIGYVFRKIAEFFSAALREMAYTPYDRVYTESSFEKTEEILEPPYSPVKTPIKFKPWIEHKPDDVD